MKSRYEGESSSWKLNLPDLWDVPPPFSDALTPFVREVAFARWASYGEKVAERLGAQYYAGVSDGIGTIIFSGEDISMYSLDRRNNLKRFFANVLINADDIRISPGENDGRTGVNVECTFYIGSAADEIVDYEYVPYHRKAGQE